jgi:chromatin remodeling complex protein RSC6
MAFGTYRIVCDKRLSEILGIKEKTELKPSEMTKLLWVYIKANGLTKK